MSDEISGDTQAVLLLCSRLGQTGSDNGAKPLTSKQYGLFVRWLRERSMRPADLLSREGREQLGEWAVAGIQRDMVEMLLDRGVALGLMTERWASRGLWVMSRSDPNYPRRFKNYLGNSAPPLLYGAGNRDLLQLGGLAVVGSREAGEEEIDYARRVGSTCAAQGIAVISGGARGIDLESMAACFEADGSAIGILADSLARYAVSRRYREGLASERLVLISPYDPETRWFAYTAMDRNKLIYGLSDAALVVTSASESGGTWSGAMEALEYARIPVYVRDGNTIADGNRKLLARGAKPFPAEPWDDLRSLFTPAPPASVAPPAQDPYLAGLPALLATLAQPQTQKTIEGVLNLTPAQAKAWLKRACDERKVRKLGRPVRYVAIDESSLLFADEPSPHEHVNPTRP